MIPVSRLSESKTTALEEKTATVTVACDSPATTALRLIDNRAASVVQDAAQAAFNKSRLRYAYGLGTVAGKGIGAYTVGLREFKKGDGTQLHGYAVDSGGNWYLQKFTDGNLFFGPGIQLLPVDYLPGGGGFILINPFQTYSGTLAVKATIDKLSNLPTTGEIPLDGSATLELVYR